MTLRNTAIRYIFLFRKPQFPELDFIDLIIDNEPIFLIAWKLKYGYKLQIKVLKTSIKRKEGSLILKLPASSNFIEIVASNFWRRSKRKILLKHTRLDQMAASSLIQQFRPLSLVEIKQTFISTCNTIAVFKQPAIASKPLKVHLKQKINIKTKNLNYP